MLQNVIAGLQGIIDHAMVGHFVGYTANAAIGVSWQIILVVIVFISSVFTGMAVLVARFAGANQPDKVNRVVYQAFLTAVFMAIILAIIGYFASPAARMAPLSRKKTIMPTMPTSIARRNGNAWIWTSGAAWTRSSRLGAKIQPAAPSVTDSPTAVRNAW